MEHTCIYRNIPAFYAVGSAVFASWLRCAAGLEGVAASVSG